MFWQIKFSEEAALTNVGRVMEARGRELLGDAYQDPITSFTDLYKFSNENPEVADRTRLFRLPFIASYCCKVSLLSSVRSVGSVNRRTGRWSLRIWVLISVWSRLASGERAMRILVASGYRAQS